jgi:predicted transcriptional regulator
MGRPPAKELTERELEVMHAFWDCGEMTAHAARDHLASKGLDRAYTTVATLIRILGDKGFLQQINTERPFRYAPARSYAEVSRSLLGDLVERVFRGSRAELLMRLVEERRLTDAERAALERLLKGGGE